LDALNALQSEGRAEQLSRAGELAKESEELPQLLEVWLSWWRDLLLLQSGMVAGSNTDGVRVTNVDREPLLLVQVAQLSTAQIQAALQATRLAVRQLGQNANPRLVMEVLALSLPRVGSK
jgi:DNA polymerase III gamma/tau subunit